MHNAADHIQIGPLMFFFFLFLHLQLLVIFGASVINNVGYYKLIRLNFILKISFGCILLVFGINHPWLLLVIMIVDGFVYPVTEFKF